MTKAKLRKWDTAEHLKTEEDIVLYLKACLDEAGDDPAFIAAALGDVARAKGMTQLAKETRLGRESSKQTKPHKEPYIKLTRISDSAFYELLPYTYPFFESFNLGLSYYQSPETVSLAQYYAGLRISFGKQGYLYDDYKGSFSFSFKADIYRNDKIYHYLLKITHYRNRPEFHFRRFVSNPHNLRSHDFHRYHEVIEDELSKADMLYIESFLYGYTQGLTNLAKKHSRLIKDFILVTESNLIISGYIKDDFFQLEFDSFEEFEKAQDHYQDLIQCAAPDWPYDDEPIGDLVISLDYNYSA